MLNSIIEKILKSFVPEVSENELAHQMEYLNFTIIGNDVKLTGPHYNQHPCFLESFYEMDAVLIPALEKELNAVYTQYIHDFTDKVLNAQQILLEQKIQPDKLFLNDKRSSLIKNGFFLGIPITFHNAKEEFLTAFQYNYLVLLR